MKSQLTALDLHFIVKELDILKNAKIDKVYQPEKHEFLFVFHVPNTGKKILRIGLPDHMFLTEYKGEMPEQPDQFCLILRKYLTMGRLRSVEQLGFERIACLSFETKSGIFRVYVELFSKGNIVLCTEEGIIKAAWLQQKWKDRTIRGGIKYEYPKRELDFLKITEQEFRLLVKSSDKESIVKILALDLGLGGKYAEELCTRAGTEKGRREVSDEAVGALYVEIERMRDSAIDAWSVGTEVAPFGMQSIAGSERKVFPSFNDALASVLDSIIIDRQQSKHDEKSVRELQRLEKMRGSSRRRSEA